jgi:repressor LexA
VSTVFLKNRSKVFAIKAVGSSMNKANIDGKNIEDGDYVIIDAVDKDFRSNDYVLSIIDEMANVKKIIINKEHRQVCLASESTQNFSPIYIEESEAAHFYISGKVIQVIKHLDI